MVPGSVAGPTNQNQEACPAMTGTERTWSQLRRYRRIYLGAAVLLALMLLLATLRPETSLAAGTGAAVAVILLVWALVRVGSTHCPHCDYRLRSLDALFWKRCRQCKGGLVRGAA